MRFSILSILSSFAFIIILGFIFYNVSCSKADKINSEKRNRIKYDKKYYATGELKTVIPIVNDKYNGLGKVFHKNGALSLEMPYKNGKLNGIVKSYLADGKLLEEKTYNDGIQHGMNRIYSNPIAELWYWNGNMVTKEQYLKKAQATVPLRNVD